MLYRQLNYLQCDFGVCEIARDGRHNIAQGTERGTLW